MTERDWTNEGETEEKTKARTEGQKWIQTKPADLTHNAVTMAFGDDDNGRCVCVCVCLCPAVHGCVFNLIWLWMLALTQKLPSIWFEIEISLNSLHFHPKCFGVCVCMCFHARGKLGCPQMLPWCCIYCNRAHLQEQWSTQSELFKILRDAYSFVACCWGHSCTAPYPPNPIFLQLPLPTVLFKSSVALLK